VTRRSARAEDAGGATVLVVAMAGVLLFLTAGLAAAGGLVTAQRRAQGVADLAALGAAAALAGSGSAGDPCGAAGRVAGAHGAALERCSLDGREVTVTVAVAGPDVPWQEVLITADARAGPG